MLHWNQVPISERFRDIWLQIYRSHDLDLLGSRDVIGHVTIWYPYSISYRRSIVTNSLSPAVFEILGPKHIGVKTLTFQGHVTSSITWRFDSPYRVSYWCSIGTKSLFPSVFEVFGSLVPVQCKLSLCMRDITWPVPLCKFWVHIWISHPHIAYSLWHFYLAAMKIKGCLLVRPPMLNAKSRENFLSPDQNWANFGGFGCLGVRGYKKVSIFTPKGTCVRESTSFEPFCVKIGQGVWPPGRLGKKPRKSQRLP